MFRVATVDVHASQVSVIVQDDVERELSCRTCKPEKWITTVCFAHHNDFTVTLPVSHCLHDF